MLIDIGANLTHNSFQSDLDAVLVTGADAQGSRDALTLARKHLSLLYATAGVHPHHAKDFHGETEALLSELQSQKEVVAVGETGLDYNRNFSPREAQLFAFERQLGLAIACGKPLFLHQRDAHADLLSCLDNVRDRISRAVVHCFTGEKKELFDYLDRDFYIGITGWICDERRGAHLRELVKIIPADRLMLETDAPYLLPRTIRPMPKDRRNEPMYLAHIRDEVARDRDESREALSEASVRTTEAFFNL
jgi:TatD DNase family protein